ncbi:hypothetical protein I302_104046 [Kwoniella bestiolae CBS 10118]|uniref:CENP-C homolog n=1 Tax=Kwoniella bestiolae CBS 10118 TaxID=1296100 RepID=A0A1B9GA53_9TREE|nr:hypothetical protein I302_02751 [Kwoniella bestiolae CBS 10118]OCF27901.1 hypothetical protein I302_02751 [Kwoniella bestiolae CBS 10118]
MSQRTPGKGGRRGEEKHFAYNDDPKNVGSRTNAPMPTGVARLADGFEDPAAFFTSPTNTEYGISNRTISSVFGKGTPKTPGARSDYTSAQTPMTGDTGITSLGTARRSRSRMSDIDVDEDEEDEERLDGDLLQDDDELQAAVPRFSMDHNHHSTKSRVSLSSPGLNTSFGSFGSPRASNSATRSSPRKSTLTSHNRATPSRSKIGRVSDITDHTASPLNTSGITNQDDLEAEEDESPRRSTRKSTRLSTSPTIAKKDRRQSSRVPDSQPGEESFTIAGDTTRGSVNTTTNGDGDREGSYSDNEIDVGGPSFDVDNGMDEFDDTIQDLDLGGDDNDVSGEQPEEDVSLEQDAIDQENDVEPVQEEEKEETPRRVEKERKRKVVAKRKTAQKRRDENTPPARLRTREGSVAAKPKRTRVSQIGMGDIDEETEDGYHGNFQTRRSNRQHFRPLEWWRGEKFEYQRGPGLPVIAEVITIPEETPQPLSQRYKKTRRAASTSNSTKKRSRSRQDSYSDQDGEEEEGWDNETEPTGLVKTYPDGMESHRKIACPKSLLVPSNKTNQTFSYQKVFGEGDFMAAGVVVIPVGQSKTTKPSKDNAYVFYVIQGAVQVQIYRTSFIMAPGGQFLVPRGNEYSIENISKKEAQLFFAQARKVKASEQELQETSASTSGFDGHANGTDTVKKTARKKQRKNASDEDDGDGDDY